MRCFVIRKALDRLLFSAQNSIHEMTRSLFQDILWRAKCQYSSFFHYTYPIRHFPGFLYVMCHEDTGDAQVFYECLQVMAHCRLGFRIEGHRHHIFGRCRRCVSKKAELRAR